MKEKPVTSKYQPIALPQNAEEAIAWAELREEWARSAHDLDMTGSAREFELTALLLRAWAKGGTVNDNQ